MRITREFLVSLGACRDQVGEFDRLFPDGVTVTRKLCLAYAREFDLEWLAHKSLSPRQHRIYDEAMAEPRRIYDAAKTEQGRIYQEAIKEDRYISYEEVEGLACAYDEAMANHRRMYEEAIALAFADAALEEG